MQPRMNHWAWRLSAFAAFDPPAGGWAAVTEARRRRDSRQVLRWPAALAAVVLSAAAGLGWWLQSAQNEIAAVAELPAPRDVLLPSERVRAENARLEWLLATLPERHAMRGSTAFTVAELEDRLAQLDDRLSVVVLEPNAPERAERLWQERVNLMHSLVQVRYADAVGTY
ncbi:MAG: hypothetical protein ACREVI_16860 [Steroidobacteraceae bacterium]